VRSYPNSEATESPPALWSVMARPVITAIAGHLLHRRPRAVAALSQEVIGPAVAKALPHQP